jgi:orotidine-5'-phosphate decarboxylase
MSHIAANEGYGLKLEDGSTIFELFLQRTKSWLADGVIMGSTRPEKIKFAKSILEGSPCKIFSPGSGAQGGNPSAALDAGSDYLIYGRSIVASKNPQAAVKEIYHSLLPWVEGKR